MYKTNIYDQCCVTIYVPVQDWNYTCSSYYDNMGRREGIEKFYSKYNLPQYT